jgi:fibro-slime domain-containing protein
MSRSQAADVTVDGMMRVLSLAGALVLIAACGGHNGNSGVDGGGGGGDAGLGGGGDGGSVGGDAGDCGMLHGVIRDFVGVEQPGYHGTGTAPMPHPDFEHAPADGSVAIHGLVLDTISVSGGDRKPALDTASPDLAAAFIQDSASFARWYTDTPGMSARVERDFPLTEDPPGSGSYSYDTTSYFPIDDAGWGIEYGGGGAGQPEIGDDGQAHNFHFTTEFHASFLYQGGEQFTFRGDDDVWVFINDKLAIDIGGIHSAVGEEIDFDAQTATDLDAQGNPMSGPDHVHQLDLGITPGHTYNIDFFQAERHVTGSNFRIQTSIDCFGGVVQ